MHTCWEACGEEKRGEETAYKTPAVICTPGGRQTSLLVWVSKKLTPPPKPSEKSEFSSKNISHHFPSSGFQLCLTSSSSPPPLSLSLLSVTQSPAPPAGHLMYRTHTQTGTSSAGGRDTARLTPEHGIRASRAFVMTQMWENWDAL